MGKNIFFKKIFVSLLALFIAVSSSLSLAATPTDSYLESLKIAATDGSLSNYFYVTGQQSSRIRTIVFNPENFGGKTNKLYLLFDDQGQLISFRMNEGKTISLDEERKALFSILKSNEEVVREFFKNPTPELRDALIQVMEPVTSSVTEKIEGQLKTNTGKWINDFGGDVGVLGKKTATGVSLLSLTAANFTSRALDSIICIAVGAWLVVNIIGFPIYIAIFHIPLDFITPKALLIFFEGTAVALVLRKVVTNFILRKITQKTGQKIKELKKEDLEAVVAEGIASEKIGDDIDKTRLAACTTKLKALAAWVFWK